MMDDEEVFGDSRTDDYSQRVTMYNNREFNQQVMIEGASYIRLLRDDSSTKMHLIRTMRGKNICLGNRGYAHRLLYFFSAGGFPLPRTKV